MPSSDEQDHTDESKHKAMTIRLHLFDTLDFMDKTQKLDMAKLSKQGRGGDKVNPTDDVKAAKEHKEGKEKVVPVSMICYGGRQPGFAGAFKYLAEKGVPELELFFPEKLTWDGVDVPDSGESSSQHPFEAIAVGSRLIAYPASFW